MILSLIVAVGPNGEIGRAGKLPWPRIRPDMRWFAARTRRKPIIMGRRTWNSLPTRPLPGRHNIVLTHDADGVTAPLRDWSARAQVDAVATPADALALARLHAEQMRPDDPPPGWEPEAMVIGGGQVYRHFLPLADRVYLTKVQPMGRDGFPEADATFPYPLPPAEWEERQEHDRWFTTGSVRVGFFTYTRK